MDGWNLLFGGLKPNTNVVIFQLHDGVILSKYHIFFCKAILSKCMQSVAYCL